VTDAAPPPDVPDVPDDPGVRPVIPRATNILLALAGATVAAFGLAAISSVSGPVLFSLVLTITVQPVRIALEKRGVPRGVATVSVILAVFGLLLGFMAALFLALGQFASLLPQFGPQLQEFAASVGTVLEKIGFGPDQVKDIVEGFDPSAILDLISGFLGGIGGLVFWLVTVLTTLLLMAMDGSYLPALLRQLRPTRTALVDAVGIFAHGVRRYMAVTTGLGIVQGLFNWFALALLGVPGAALWGMLSFLCSFIPNIGYFIAIIPPIVFGALVGGWQTVIWVIVIYGVINALVQSVVQPRIVGNAVLLNQTITFVSVLFWAIVLGPIGAIIAIPMTLLVRMLLIDSDPKAKWWRPLTGDIVETRTRLRNEDVQRKAERKAAHEEAEWHDD
jgi:predicted PurR-regulated permease PerM